MIIRIRKEEEEEDLVLGAYPNDDDEDLNDENISPFFRKFERFCIKKGKEVIPFQRKRIGPSEAENGC